MLKIKNITVCSLFSALICIGAFIKIPIPALAITMQVFFVLLSGMLLGRKKGLVSTAIYVAVGLAGIPVFSSGGGISYILNPRFGYLIGFIVSSYVTGLLCEKNSSLKNFLTAGFAGTAIIYTFGILYYYFICKYVINHTVSFEFLFIYCFLSVLPGDVLSAIFASLFALRLKKIIY